MSASGQGVARLGEFRATPDDPEANWRARAVCREGDPELFFPIGDEATGSIRTHEQIAQAKAVCAVCPVTAACLEFALSTHQTHGVWAGTTPNERIRIQRRRRDRAAKQQQEEVSEA